MSQAGDVRKILAEGPADFEALAERLDIPSADRHGRKLLRLTLTDLQKVEAVTCVDIIPPGAPPQYRLTGRTGSVDVQTKMGRAVQLKGKQKKTFTCKDLAALSGCTQEYATRYLRFLKAENYLLPAGAKKLSRFGLGLTYQVAPGREKEEPPRWNRRAQEAKQKVADARDQEPGAVGVIDQIRGYLGEMEETLAHCAAGVEQTQETLKKVMHLALVKGPEREAKDGTEDHHES